MKDANAESHHLLLETIRKAGQSGLDKARVEPLSMETAVADAPTRTLVTDPSGRPIGVLFLSSHVDSDMVRRSVTNTETAKNVLGPALGSVCLAPIAEGYFAGLSYVLWPWHRPLSRSRWVLAVQKRVVGPRILAWLRQATQRTLSPLEPEAFERLCVRPAEYALARDWFPAELRNRAETGLSRLASSASRPVSVLMHHDFWIGNVLLPRDRSSRRGSQWGFIIIDWAGARTHGFPFADLVRFLDSTLPRARTLRNEIQAHCRILECDPEVAWGYLLAALGSAGMSPGYFPEVQYRAMALRCLRSLSNALTFAG